MLPHCKTSGIVSGGVSKGAGESSSFFFGESVEQEVILAKRMRDTGTYEDPFVMGLNAAQKHLWFFVLDHCDHAGIWKANVKLAAILTDTTQDEEKALEAFGDKIKVLPGGYWFVPSFVKFQYGLPLNLGVKAILSAYNRLCEFGLGDLYETVTKGLDKGYLTTKDKDMDKDKDRDKDELKWNPFSDLMEIFKKHEVIITTRDPRQIAVVNAKGKSLGDEWKFRDVGKAYCTDQFCKKGGLSINGFLNNFDRIANQIQSNEHKAPKKLLRFGQ